jgi:signal transduction histidine kinase
VKALNKERRAVAGPTVRVAVVFGFGLIGAIWLFAGYYFTARMSDVERRSASTSARYLRAQDLLTAARGHILLGAMTVRDALIDPVPEKAQAYRRQVEDSYRAADDALARYEPVIDSPGELARIARLRADIDDYRRTLLDVLEPAKLRVVDAPALLREIFPKRQGLMRLSEEMQSINRTAFVRQQSEIAEIHRVNHRRLWESFGAAMVASFAIAFLATVYAGRLEERVKRQRDREQENAETLRRLSSQLVTAQEEERRIIARELHDEVGQVLTAIKVELSLAQRAIENAGGAPAVLQEARTIADGALETVRHLSHLMYPPLLEDLGLVPALDAYGKAFTRRHAVRIDVRHAGVEGVRFGREVEASVYRIVQEALTNVARHSDAAACTVSIVKTADALRVTIEDDGCGFDPQAVGGPGGGLGLVGIRGRATELGGAVRIESTRGQGTRLTIDVPAGQRATPDADASSVAPPRVPASEALGA